ncbi:MAG TPA: hypothetical protein DDW50_03100, partial [Firmicutes bacterium]|nr:hypothetical protein [Bacillota bacterium]
MPLHKLLKLLLCSLFLLWMSQLCAIKAEGDPFFIVPKYFHIESETSDNGYIEKINLNTGMIEKISVKVPNSQRVDDVIGLAGDDIILRCGVQEGRAFFVNLKNGDFSVDLGITAGDSSEIFVRASPNQNYFAILFGGSVNGVSSNQIWLFERNPLKLEKKIKIKADTVQDTFFVDNVSNAYLSFDEDLAIWSLAHDQELKKINLKAGCQQIVDGKALFMVDDKNKGIVDFDTGNVQSLSPEYGADTLTSDGKWLVTRQYQKSDKSSDDEFSGQITIIDLQRDTRKVVYIDPKIVNYHFETSQDAYYYFDGKFYLFNKQTMAIVELETGKVTIKPLQYKSKVSNTSNVPMEQGQKIK